MKNPSYTDLVFVNCPFDTEYFFLLRAAIFTIYRCGFFPKTALNEDNALDNRLEKIQSCIECCRFGIHDLSRTALNDQKLPRFNMPFELGLFFGAKRFGGEKHISKNAIIFDAHKYRYQKYISDLSGVDVKSHSNNPLSLIKQIRDWLSISSRRKNIPGENILIKQYKDFKKSLGKTARSLGFNSVDIPFNDFCGVVEEYIAEIL